MIASMKRLASGKPTALNYGKDFNVTGAPPPEPSADNRPNSTTVVPPAMAPTGPSHNIIPGKISF